MRNNIRILAILVSLSMLMACATTVNAPKGSIPRRKHLSVDAFGAYITIRLHQTDSILVAISGELLAVAPDSIHIMVADRFNSYSKQDIWNGRVVYYQTDAGNFTVWTVLLSLGTISNGGFLIGTFPLTLITGIATTAGESKRINYYDIPATSWDDVRKFARFPQGLPGMHNRDEFHPRPANYRYD